MQKVERQIWDMLAPAIADMGFQIVRVRLTGSAGRDDMTLQLMIEPPQAGPDNTLSVTVDDCAAVSRTASALLDVADPISGAYRLEVSSTGVERPLILAEDFKRYAGCLAKVELYDPVGERKRFDGELKGFADGHILLVQSGETEVSRLPFESLKSAKRVLRESEIAALMKRRD